MEENQFPAGISEILDYLEFIQVNEETYKGKGQNVSDNPDIKFVLNNGYIYCYQDYDTLLFTIPDEIENGYFLVLLQAFGIIHERYIYERVDGINDDFFNNLDRY
jgi:hypothetical protein